jgi:plastocyanin
LVLLAACGGGSRADIQTLATQSADVAPSAALTITAKDLKFDKKALVVPANTAVTLTLVNEDAGALHNVAIYRDESAKENVYRGELFEGKKTVTYALTSPPAGVYYFRCDAHPDMNGAFIAR